MGKKEDLIKLRVQVDEKKAFQRAADIAGVSLSAWTRERLRKAARIELQEVGHKIPFMPK